MKTNPFRNLIVLSCILIIPIFATPGLGTEFPYSLQTGDKVSYSVTELKNGTQSGSYYIKGLNLTKGDTFAIEIFDRPAKPTSVFGTEFKIRFVKGDVKGEPFAGSSYVYTNNASYWNTTSYANQTIDVGGTIYSYTFKDNIGTFSWTTDADNLVKITFDVDSGILQSFERRTEDFSTYNYTHFRFEITTSSFLENIPGFDSFITLVSVLTFILFVNLRKKTN